MTNVTKSTATSEKNLLVATDVQRIAVLACLTFDDSTATQYADNLNEILALMDQLASVDTDGILPMQSPFEVAQPLREDVVSEQNHREAYQAIAPAVEDGLYLVPRVIE